jgi:UDP-N-acetylglucosamine--N-acetylmuramyl-(pentapeptide) pyrophosphoryl-undecaprenol N-acetylglucosamine transferase
MALVNENAALMVKDVEAKDKLISVLSDLMQDHAKLKSLSENLSKLGKPHAAKEIAQYIFNFLKEKRA